MVTSAEISREESIGSPHQEFVLGGNVFGGTMDADQSYRVLDAFYEQGGRHIDTADVYANWMPGRIGGESETIIGDWMRRRGVRDEMTVATKVGLHPEMRGDRKSVV